MSMQQFLAKLRREATMGGGRDRQDVASWTVVGDQETELLRVEYASPRLLAISIFCSGDPLAVADLNDSPRVTIQAGTDRGTIRIQLLTEVSRLSAITGIPERGQDLTHYPPQLYGNGQASNGENGNVRTYTPSAPIQIPAQSLRVTVQKPIKLIGTTTPAVYAQAIVAPVCPDVTEVYAAKALEMMAAFVRRR